MNETFNMNTVLVANFLGILLVAVMFVSGAMKLTDGRAGKRYLLLLTLSVLFSCIADPLAFGFDGKTAPGARLFVYAGNTWLYLANICIAYFWLNVMLRHLNITISKVHRTLLLCVVAAAALLLVFNLFVPVVFGVDAANRYQRGPLFAVYTVINILILLDSVLIYYRARKASGGLMFFPIWIYLVPGLIGILIQSLFYGISVIGPCAAISVAGLVISLEREALTKDKLTGLYNRYYLDRIKDSIPRRRGSDYTLLMLDMNHFKMINDRYGHSEGDRALIKASELLKEALKDIGIIIRYGGDEFVVILFTQDDDTVRQQIGNIHSAFAAYTATGATPYELSVSVGQCRMGADRQSINEALSTADQRMYENKMKLYAGDGQAST